MGCQYKIVSKLLARRLKSVLLDLIADNQSAFVANRQILDGVLMASKVVKWVEGTRKKLLLFKVDFAKAFDCLN